VGLGCNYAIDRRTGQTLLDEKRGGTFHIALGASLPQSDGQNVSTLHWDLIADLHAGGRIEADGQTISANGRFIDPTWPQPSHFPTGSNHG
jgi:aminopeptidase